jgi:hypothetical protein
MKTLATRRIEREEYLFDLSATVSVLVEEQIVFDRGSGGERATILAASGPADCPTTASDRAHSKSSASGVRSAIASA